MTFRIIAEPAMQSPAPITMNTPILTSSKPGRTTISVPRNPTASAIQRVAWAGSFRNITPKSAMNSGNVNEIAVASASAIRVMPPNQPYMAAVLRKPRAT